MDLNKLSTADKVIGASAIVFLISMFLPWWGIDLGAGLGTASNSGFDYVLTGLLPALLVIVMVAQIVLDKLTATQLPEIPLKWGQVHMIAGIAVAVLVVLRLLVPSSEGSGAFEIDLDRQYGMFVAALAAIGVGVGGFLKSKEPESVYDSGPSAYPGAPPPPPPGGASF
jgi:hypothetical protein